MPTLNERSLIGHKEFPAVSIILPAHPQTPKSKLDREYLNSLLSQAEEQMLAQYSRIKTENLMDKLHHAVNTIKPNEISKGLAIYVSDTIEKVIHLPFSVTEKVIVDNSFEIRDLLMAAKMNRNYLVLIISQNKVKSFFGYGSHLIPVHFEGMPENVKDVSNEHSYPGWDYLDVHAYEEKNIHNYLRFIDDVIEKETKGTNDPVIVMGDTKLVGFLKNHTRNTKKIIGFVEGNYEHADFNEIRSRIRPYFDTFEGKEQDSAFDLLQNAVNSNTYSAGISEVWRSAAEAKGRLLLVERDYKQSARFGDDSYSILIDKEVERSRSKIVDAVDDIIEMVLLNHGDVVFVENGKLNSFQRIALINRY